MPDGPGDGQDEEEVKTERTRREQGHKASGGKHTKSAIERRRLRRDRVDDALDAGQHDPRGARGRGRDDE